MTRSDSAPLIYVVDDDADLAASLARMLRQVGHVAEPFVDPEILLQTYAEAPSDCIVTDVMMHEMDGFGFADRVREIDPAASIIFMTAWPTAANAVDAVRHHGGLDYLEKPIDTERLLRSIEEAIRWTRRRRGQLARLSQLTARERDVFDLLVKGLPTKRIAAELNLSPRTIDDHRARIAAKTGATSLAELIALSEG